MQDEAITETIIGCAFKVHNTLGPGYLEKVYKNAMCIELAKQGLQVRQQQPVTVHYEGQVVGEYLVDLWVEDRIIVELKAIQTLTKAHEAQVVNYLTATGTDIGLLINFGASSVEIKRKHRVYKPKQAA
jgi:GxxExxY protein